MKNNSGQGEVRSLKMVKSQQRSWNAFEKARILRWTLLWMIGLKLLQAGAEIEWTHAEREGRGFS